MSDPGTDFAVVLDALRDLWAEVFAAEGEGFVRDAAENVYAPGRYLVVGATGPDPGDGVETSTEPAGLGKRPHQVVRIPCRAWSASGGGTPKVLRDDANAIFRAAVAALRANRNLGGLVDRADVVLWTYRPYGGGGGVAASVDFVVEAHAL